GLEYEKPLANVKEEIENGMLENIVKEYFIDNPHALLMVLKPQPGLEKEIAEETRKKLAEYKASLSKEELEKLVQETKELKEYQQKEDSPEAIATVPMLSLEDISKEVQWYEVKEKAVSNVPVLHYEDFTSNIIYSNLYFDMYALPKELIPYANLLAELVGSMNTENYTYGELDNALNIHTGGFNTYLTSYLENNDDEKLIPKFAVNAKATIDKTDKLFELTTEILNQTKLDDIDRLKDLIIRHQSQIESMVKNNGVGIATTRLNSYYSNQGMFNELTRGLSYYEFITELTENFDSKSQEIIDNLEKTATLLFNKNNLITNITCSEENYVDFKKEAEGFVSQLPNEEVVLNDWAFEFEVKNEGLMSSSMVQYVIKGYDFKKLGYEWDGKMRVLNQILSRDYLQNKIRVMGGAYGGWARIAPSGNTYFASYRDPNLKETFENYDAATEFLAEFDADETAMTRFIIGTISNIDRPTTASQRGWMAVDNYFTKTTKEELEKERNAILNTTAKDVKSYEQMIREIMKQDIICVYGNDQKIKANQDLFKEIKPITK
ncbi:MAG: peptidase, partial [Bacteroidota bacterium]